MQKLFSFILVLSTGFVFAQVNGHVSVYWPQSNVYMNSIDMIAAGNNGILDLRGAFPAASNFALCRVDSSGNPMWHYEFVWNDTADEFYPEKLVALPGNDFLVTGHAYIASTLSHGFFAMRFDSNATMVWKKLYIPANPSNASVITLYDPGNPQRIYFAWNSIMTSGPWSAGMTIFKADLNGNIIDTAFFLLQNFDFNYPRGTINTSGNLVFASGSTNKLGFAIVDTSLQVVHANIISGAFNFSTVRALSEAAPGKYLLAGTDGTYGNFWMRLDSTGQLEYHTRIIPYLPFRDIEAMERTSTGDVYAIIHSEASITQNTNTNMAHFNDTGGVVDVYGHRGGGLRNILICNDAPVLSLQVPHINNYPTAYVQTDSAGRSSCNSDTSYIQYYQPTITLTQAVTSATYVPVSVPAMLPFNDTSVLTTLFNTIDFCLLNTIAESADEKFSIWPVPATDKINVSGPSSGTTYVVYDVSGNEILKGYMTSNSLNIASLAPGYYIIEVSGSRDQPLRKPFIKQ